MRGSPQTSKNDPDHPDKVAWIAGLVQSRCEQLALITYQIAEADGHRAVAASRPRESKQVDSQKTRSSAVPVMTSP
ncbi:unnamed protein product, partial [Iphiclides podalirius]